MKIDETIKIAFMTSDVTKTKAVAVMTNDDSLTLLHAKALAYLSHASPIDKFGASYR